MDAIQIENLGFMYSDSNELILKDINLTIEYGKITLLTGKTGIGKSTLLSLITRLIPNEKSGEIRGDIKIDGQSVQGMSITDISSKIAFVLQDVDSQIFHKYADDEILFGMENIGIEKEKAFEIKDDILKQINISSNRIVSTLSGGEKSLLMILSMINMGQKIIILDEPFANLDNKKAKFLLEVLSNKAKEGKAILICEHRTSLVEPYTDKIVRIENGKIIEENKENETTQTLEKHNKEFSEESLLLNIENINVSYGVRKLLDNVSFKLHKGERIVIIGGNGEGKTTLLKIISGLNKCKRIKVKENITKKNNIHSHKWFKNVAFVFQNPTYELFKSTVKKELLFHCKDKEYALKIGEELQLDNLYDRHPHSLSEGEKRRLTIACAIVRKVKVIFLDEPSVGQDKDSSNLILNKLNELVEKDELSLVTVTHDYTYVNNLSDNIYELKKGKLSLIK